VPELPIHHKSPDQCGSRDTRYDPRDKRAIVSSLLLGTLRARIRPPRCSPTQGDRLLESTGEDGSDGFALASWSFISAGGVTAIALIDIELQTRISAIVAEETALLYEHQRWRSVGRTTAVVAGRSGGVQAAARDAGTVIKTIRQGSSQWP